MKKHIFFVAVAILLSACGTSKKAVNNSAAQQVVQDESLGTLIQKSREQLYAEDPDAENMRAWAMYNGFENQNLESFAAAAARANLATEIATLVKNAIEIYDNGARIDNKAVDGVAENVKTAESKGESKITAVAKELINGSRIVMSDRYRQKDGTINCFAAVEVDVKGVLKNIKNNASIQEAISESRKAKIDYNSARFDEAMQEAFAELKGMKEQ